MKTETKGHPNADVVLEEVWHIKDALSASYGHDVHRLFAETREREKNCGHPLVSLSDLRIQPAKGRS